MNLVAASQTAEMYSDGLMGQPSPLSQSDFDVLKIQVLQLQIVIEDLYNNRYGNAMDPPYPDLQTQAMDRMDAVVSALQAYATANSLTF